MSIFDNWKFTLSLSLFYLVVLVMAGGIDNLILFCLAYWVSIRQFNSVEEKMENDCV